MTPPPRRLPDAEGRACGAVAALHDTHYRPLVRLAALLVRDVTTAEDIVQDSFVALRQRRRRHDIGFALFYLRRTVVRRSRAALRRPVTAGQPAPRPAPGGPGAHQHPMAAALEQPAILSALGRLPGRQREAIVLRYYADLPDAQIASIMGIRPGALKSHTARALTSLRAVLGSLQE